MNKDIQIFNHPEFGVVRVVVKDGRNWFCLSDVCKSLSIGNPSELKKRLQDGGVISTDTPVTNQFGVTYNQGMTYINEESNRKWHLSPTTSLNICGNVVGIIEG